jgi:hypothetical protein
MRDLRTKEAQKCHGPEALPVIAIGERGAMFIDQCSTFNFQLWMGQEMVNGQFSTLICHLWKETFVPLRPDDK